MFIMSLSHHMLHCLNSRPQNREGKATLTKDWFTDLLIWAPFWVLFVSTFSGHFLWVLFLATFLGTFFWESFLGTWIYNIKLSFRKNLWLHIKSIHKRYLGLLLEMGKTKTICFRLLDLEWGYQFSTIRCLLWRYLKVFLC